MPEPQQTRKRNASTIRVGPAGWSYADWAGIVYPARKPAGFHEAAYLSQFFDTIEPFVEAYENWDKSEKREKFLYDDKAFKVILPNLPGRDLLRKALFKFEFSQAVHALREKWFSIDLGIRIKARPYLAERLLGKVK